MFSSWIYLFDLEIKNPFQNENLCDKKSMSSNKSKVINVNVWYEFIIFD